MDQILWGKKFHFCLFWGIFETFDPLVFTNQNFPKVKDTKIIYISTAYIFRKFQKNEIIIEKLFQKRQI